jgi:hypothetical protein
LKSGLGLLEGCEHVCGVVVIGHQGIFERE